MKCILNWSCNRTMKNVGLLHMLCNNCTCNLINWSNGRRNALPFAIPPYRLLFLSLCSWIWQDKMHLSWSSIKWSSCATLRKSPGPFSLTQLLSNNESESDSEDSLESSGTDCAFGVNKVTRDKFNEFVRRMSLKKSKSEESVSYTHLTLPTIYSV